MTRLCCFAWGLVLWLATGSASAWGYCSPELLGIQVAAELAGSTVAGPATHASRPAKGWIDVKLPNNWAIADAQAQTTVWYRIDWQQRCSESSHAQPWPEPVALGIDAIRMAGEVYSNDTLVWRDESLVEPLSRSWNMPRWWILPEPSLHDGVNSVWVKVVGSPALAVGLGELRLGSIAHVQAVYKQRWWSQRTVFMLTLGMALAIGGLFFVVWLLRRSEQSYGWYALTSLSWAGYLATLLATSSQPWHEALGLSRLNVALFAIYIGALCMFMWRFGGQRFAAIERLLAWAVVVAVASVMFAPKSSVPTVFGIVWFGSGLVFMLNCLQFQWHVWRPRATGRNRQNMLLALCWLFMLCIAVHDMLLVFNEDAIHRTWNPIVGPIATLLMALLLGGRLAQGMRKIERFNFQLEERVTVARAELEQAVSNSHAQALDNAKLQERVQIAHDLHDGLGGTLVRGLALVEQAPDMVPKERMVSMLKIMRDDLRQVIDHGASSNTLVPESPLQWIAPVRHRFTRILDELNVVTRWRIAPEWPGAQRPTALQCLGLTRLVEEALANVIKHSRAQHVRVTVLVQEDAHEPQTMSVYVEDDGIGFDVAAVQNAGLTVGFKSMATRAERIGAVFSVESGPSGTSVCAIVPLANALDVSSPQAQQINAEVPPQGQPAPDRAQPSVVFAEKRLGT